MPTPKELEEFQKAGPVQFTVDLSSIVRARPPSGPYRVVSGDVLTIKMPVLDPAFQQEFYEAGMVLRRVRDDGKIKLPALADFEAAGKTLNQIELEIDKGYYPGMLNSSPEVVVRVAEYSTRYVDVLGGVATPGRHQLRSDELSLVAALMRAGNVVPQGAGLIRITCPGEKQAKEIVLPVKGLNEPFVDVPLVGGETIEVVKIDPQFFTIMGLVGRPGTYALSGDTRINLIQAVGLAGGADPVGDPRYATIHRQAPDNRIVSARFKLNGDSWFANASIFADNAVGQGAFAAIKPGDVIVLEKDVRTRTREVLAKALFLQVGASAAARTEATYYQDYSTSGGGRTR